MVNETIGTDLEEAINVLVPQWIGEAWPFKKPRYIGRDLTWKEWLALPDIPTRHAGGDDSFAQDDPSRHGPPMT